MAITAIGETAEALAEGISTLFGGASAGAASGSEAGGTSIVTRYRTEVQGTTTAAHGALAGAKSGATLFRAGKLGESMAGESQYWSLQNPLQAASYASEMGLPTLHPDFMMGGTLANGAGAIANGAAGLGANAGGGIQIVTEIGMVVGLWFHMP